MNEMIIDTKALHETMTKLITTEKVKISEENGEFRLTPIRDSNYYIQKAKVSLSEYPDMSLDKFLERKHQDKELERCDTDTDLVERLAWLEEFHDLLKQSAHEEMPDFPRVHLGREFIDLSDEG